MSLECQDVCIYMYCILRIHLIYIHMYIYIYINTLNCDALSGQYELELGITTLFLILSEEDISAYYLHGLVEMPLQDLMQYAEQRCHRT